MAGVDTASVRAARSARNEITAVSVRTNALACRLRRLLSRLDTGGADHGPAKAERTGLAPALLARHRQHPV